MIEELADLLDDFPGETNRTRCFTHVINLVAKSIIKQFDVPKTQAGDVLDGAAKELAALNVGLDIEELTSREADQNDTDEDNIEGWHDPRQDLSDEEREVLDKSLQPVRLVLVKASYKIT
jgi:hypothetical protein